MVKIDSFVCEINSQHSRYVNNETKKANCLANDGDEMEIGELTWENVFEKKLKNETFEGEVSEEELWNAYRNAYFQISEFADVNAQ